MGPEPSHRGFCLWLLPMVLWSVLCCSTAPSYAGALVLGVVAQPSSPLLNNSSAQQLADYLADRLGQPVTLRTVSDQQNLQYWMSRIREVDFGLFDQSYLQQHGRGEFILLAACRPRGHAEPLLLVARRGVEPALFTAAGRAVLDAGGDPAGRQLLQRLGVSGFLSPADASAATPAEATDATATPTADFHLDYPADGSLTGPTPLLVVDAPSGSRLLLDGAPLATSSGGHLGPLADGEHRLELFSPAGERLVSHFRVDAKGPMLTVDPFPASLRGTGLLLSGSCEAESRLHLVFPGGLHAGSLRFPTAGRWELALSDIQPGRHQLELLGWDRYGNETRLAISFERDLTPPQLQIISPEAGGSYSRLPALKLQAEPGDLQLRLDGQPLAGPVLPEGLADGKHLLEAELRDRAGNLSQSRAAFRIDRKLPLLSVDPFPRDLQVPQTVIAGSREAGATLAVDLQPASASARVQYPGPDRWMLALEGLQEGENRVHLRLTDPAGHQSEQELLLVVDRTPPHLELISPPAGDIADPRPVFKAAFSEGHLEIWLDGRQLSVANGDRLGPLADGAHQLLVNAVDAAGNQSQQRRDFIVDTHPPQVTILAPAPGASVRPPLRPQWQVSEADARVEVRLDDAPLATEAGEPLGTPAPGRHRLEVAAIDPAGNRGTAAVEFVVPGKGPDVYLTSPMAGVTYDRTPLLEYQAGAGRQRVLVDGAEVDKRSGQSLDALADGPHQVRVEVTDATGNVGRAEQRFVVSAGTASRLLPTASPLELPPADTSFAITLQQSVLPADFAGQLQLTIRGLSRLGETVYVQQWVDKNRNGVADAGEPVVAVTRLTDGLTSPAAGVPGDDDGLENRVIVTRLDFGNLQDERHRPGQYILLAIGEREVSETVLRIEAP